MKIIIGQNEVIQDGGQNPRWLSITMVDHGRPW